MLSVSATTPAAWFDIVTTASALPDIAFHTTPSISPYRRDLLAATLNHLNELKEKNPSRMYLYNLFVQNNAMNEFALELMSFIAEYTQYSYSRYPSKVLFEIIQESVYTACSFASSFIIARYPEIAQLLPPQASVDAARNIEAYWELVRDMSNFFPGYQPRFKELTGDPSMFHQTNPAAGYSQMQQPVNPQQAQTNIFNIEGRSYAKMPDGSMVQVALGQDGVYYAVPPGSQMPSQSMGWQNQPRQMSGPYGYGQPTASGVFNGGPHGFGQGNQYMPPAPGAQDDNFMPASVRMQKQNAGQPPQYDYSSQANTNNIAASTQTFSTSGLPAASKEDWKPSLNQPYLTFYDQEKFTETYSRWDNGDIIQRLVEIKPPVGSESTQNMERDAHILPTVRVEIARKKHFIKTVKEVNEIPTKTIIEQIDKEEVTPVTELIQDSWFSCVSTAEAIASAQIRHKEKQKEKYIDAYHTFNNIVHIVPGNTKNQKFLKILSSADKDSNNVRELLKAYRERADSSLNKHELALDKIPELQAEITLYRKINEYLTQLANEFLRYSLSLEVKIDDYVEDYEDLLTYLRNSYSDRYSSRMESFDNTVNSSLLSFTPAVDTTPVIAGYVLGEDTGALNFDTFSELSTVTSLTLTSHDLFGDRLELTSGPNGIYVDYDHNELLGQIAYFVMKNKELLGFVTFRHYLVTSDGDTFMVNKAVMADNGVVIHRINFT